MQWAISRPSRIVPNDGFSMMLDLSTRTIRQVFSHFETHGMIPECSGNLHVLKLVYSRCKCVEYMKTSRPKYYLLEGIPRLYHGSECRYVRGIKTVWHKDEDGVGGRSNGTAHTIMCAVPSLLSTHGERECNHDSSHTNANTNTSSAFIITFVLGERVVSE